MSKTRAKSAAATIETAPSEAQAPKQPMLLRLQPRTLFRDDDATKLQPRLGASLIVQGDWANSDETFTVWLPAAVWDGLGSIIRQTPNHHREGVAELFEVIHGSLYGGAMGGLLRELIAEIRNDPYEDVPEDSGNQFDVNW